MNRATKATATGVTGDWIHGVDRSAFTCDRNAFSTPAKVRPRVRFLRIGFFTAMFYLLLESRAEPPGKSKQGTFARCATQTP
jgi:hypothetical protein